jgi:methyl-accepting chemotaxis protein
MTTKKYNVLITITGKDKASKPLGNVGVSLKELATIGGAVAGSVVAAGLAIKEAFEFAEEGAKVEQTADSFGYFLEKVDAAPDLLDKLRVASGHTVDDMTLMGGVLTLTAGTTDEFAKTLAGVSPRLMEIAKAAEKFNPTLGDTAYMYESLNIAAKRRSILVADNLGLTIRMNEALQEVHPSLQAMADDYDDLSEEQKFLNEMMWQGDQLIGQVGGTTDAAMDPFNNFRTSVSNLKDTFSVLVNDGMAPTLPMFSDMLWFLDEMIKRQMILSGETGYLTDALHINTRELKFGTEAAQDSWEEYRKRHGIVDYSTQKEIEFGRTVADVNEWLEENKDVVAETTRGLSLHSTALDQSALSSGNLADSAYETAEGMDAATESIKDMQYEAFYVAQDLEEVKTQFDDLKTIVGGPLREEFESFTERQEDLTERMNELNQEIDELSSQPWISTKDQERLEELREDYEGLAEQYQENADDHGEATRRILFDLATQRAAVDGLSQAELKVLTDLAQKWGLIDEETAEAITTMDEAFADLAEGESITEVTNQIMGIEETADDTSPNVDQSLTELAEGEGFNSLQSELLAIEDMIGNIAGEYDIRFNIETVGSLPDATYGSIGETYDVNAEGQHGLDFVVPPGFNYDDFLVGLSSGERVTVSRPGETRTPEPAFDLPVYIEQHFYATTTPEEVEDAAREGVLAAARSMGLQ